MRHRQNCFGLEVIQKPLHAFSSEAGREVQDA